MNDLLEKKGVKQFSKFISNFNKSSHIYDNRISPMEQKIEFIPIIVVSEDFFSSPALENYLSKKMQDVHFPHKVNSLVLLSANRLLNFQINNRDNNIFKLIHQYSKDKKKKVMKVSSLFDFPTFNSKK